MKGFRWTWATKINFALLFIFVFIAVFAPFIANDEAIICKDAEGIHSPILSNYQSENCEAIVKPLIHYNFNNIDDKNANYKSPFDDQPLQAEQQRHLLGTDQLGRDVTSGMIHGCRIALLTGGLSMLIALIIGMFFGLLGGYYGNNSIRLKRYDLINKLFLLLALSYFFIYPDAIIASWTNTILSLLLLSVISLLIIYGLGQFSYFKRKIRIPLDLLFSNFIEIFQSLPGSFIILILVSLFAKASIYNVILVIGLLRWPMIARYVRAEMLKIKEQRFIEASKAIGMSDWRIIFKHAMPATLTPVIVAVAFGFSSAILLESTLSFLGIGLPADHVSFGSMLSEARNNYEAWWLAIFPGFAIFILVYVFNYLGDQISQMIDKK